MRQNKKCQDGKGCKARRLFKVRELEWQILGRKSEMIEEPIVSVSTTANIGSEFWQVTN